MWSTHRVHHSLLEVSHGHRRFVCHASKDILFRGELPSNPSYRVHKRRVMKDLDRCDTHRFESTPMGSRQSPCMSSNRRRSSSEEEATSSYAAGIDEKPLQIMRKSQSMCNGMCEAKKRSKMVWIDEVQLEKFRFQKPSMELDWSFVQAIDIESMFRNGKCRELPDLIYNFAYKSLQETKAGKCSTEDVFKLFEVTQSLLQCLLFLNRTAREENHILKKESKTFRRKIAYLHSRYCGDTGLIEFYSDKCRHTPEHNYTCEVCQKIFVSSYFLQLHRLKRHNRDRPKVCAKTGIASSSPFFIIERDQSSGIEESARMYSRGTCMKTGSFCPCQSSLEHFSMIEENLDGEDECNAQVKHLCEQLVSERGKNAALLRELSGELSHIKNLLYLEQMGRRERPVEITLHIEDPKPQNLHPRNHHCVMEKGTQCTNVTDSSNENGKRLSLTAIETPRSILQAITSIEPKSVRSVRNTSHPFACSRHHHCEEKFEKARKEMESMIFGAGFQCLVRSFDFPLSSSLHDAGVNFVSESLDDVCFQKALQEVKSRLSTMLEQRDEQKRCIYQEEVGFMWNHLDNACSSQTFVRRSGVSISSSS